MIKIKFYYQITCKDYLLYSLNLFIPLLKLYNQVGLNIEKDETNSNFLGISSVGIDAIYCNGKRSKCIL